MAITPAQAAYLSDLLTGIGSGFLSRPQGGPPLAGFAMGIQNANQLMGQRRQMADQDQERQYRAAQIQRQTDADAEQKRKEAAAKSWLLGQKQPEGTGAFYEPGGATTASPGAISSLPAGHQSFYQGFANIDPMAAAQMAGQEMLKPPAAPDLTEFYNQDGTAFKGYLDPKTNQPVQIGSAYPRWQPPQPKGPSEMKQRALDAGLVPGTPEYRNFMLTGGTAAKSKLVDLTPEEIKARGLPIGTVAQLNPDTNELSIRNKGAEGPGGMFDTKSIPGQALNFLAAHQEDPTSLEYAIAYRVASQPSVSYLPDGTVNSYTPDVSMFRKAAYAGPQQQVDAAAASLVPDASAAPAVQPGAQPAPMPAPVPAPTPPNPNAQSQSVPGGGTVSRVQGGYQTPADIQKLKEIKSQVGSITSALDNFSAVVKEAPETDFLSAATGGMTEGGAKLNSAWTNAALQTKAEALFNLGVLNGPDLALIQGTLQNPGTMRGVFASKAAYQAGIDQIKKLIADRITSYEQEYGPKTPNASVVAPTTTAPATSIFDKFGLTPPPASANP